MPSVATPPAAAHQACVPPARQLVAVITRAWSSIDAVLTCHERDASGTWKPAANPIKVVVGRSGLAWGSGLLPADDGNVPCKKEGDGKSPAGVFAIVSLFGSGPQAEAIEQAGKMPFLSATPDLKAIDDPGSRYYNRIVDQRRIPERDWHSCEDMLRADDRYRIGAVIGHNISPPRAGAGSCIFLHAWEAAGLPTAGCTAGAPEDIAHLCAWLDQRQQPVMVQLPRPEYARLQAIWDLPRHEPDDSQRPAR